MCAGLVLTLSPRASAAAPGSQGSPGMVAAATAAPSADLLRVGDRGPQVRQWQALLNRLVAAGAVQGTALAEDGVFGPATAQATRIVQARLGLVRDGVVGPRTRSSVAELGFASGVGGSRPNGSSHTSGRRLRAGLDGSDVREWQRVLDVAIDLGRLDHPRVAQDERFGPQTRSATLALQTQLNVATDGVVGLVTREATGWLLEG